MQAKLPFSALFPFLAVLAAVPKEGLDDVLARMDQAAGSFQSMTAQAKFVEHIDVIDENNTETANIFMKKVAPNQLKALMEVTDPPNSRKTVTFSGPEVQIYYPKIKTVQIYDFGSSGEQIEQFVMIGFGTSGSELAKSYGMKVLGGEALNGQRTIKLELTPKSEQAKKYVSRLEMWIPDRDAPYPIQEKIYEPSGDYKLITYSDVRINPPLKADAVKLKLPAGVKKEYPQK